ncbi:MAG TPA: AMP-binding protein [Candidatus Acidoferrales bacterium]|nr:AMP-binding protein [Candidatus Acidoferrales bacterium]
MNVLLPTSPDFLRFQAQRRRAAGGLFFAGRRIPYGELSAAVDDLAAWLAKRGLGAGDHVGVMAANEPAMVAMMFAVWSLGGVAVPISVRSTVQEAAQLLSHSRARALLCDVSRCELARAAATAVGAPAYACEADLPLRPRVLRRGTPHREHPARAPRPERLAVLAYTSGTTGMPKGVMVTHANLLWATLACATARGDRPEGSGACLSPLTHTPVFVSHLLCRVLLGAGAVLLEKFDTELVLESVERFGITDLPLIAGMVFDVVQLKSIPERIRRSVEKVTVGGAATPMAAKRALAGIFAGAEIIEAYGQSESTDGVAMARGTSVFDHEGTVGRMNPYVHVSIRRADGSLAASAEEGEIVVSGPTVMAGYYRDRAATETTLRDGWLHTGDLGRQDADGYFFITGRVKDLIITGGENVSPREVEDVLRLHPHVADVAVIGTPHPKWGEQVTAVVVPKNGAHIEPADLTSFAGARLSGFKKPRRIELVDALPRNAANKVQTNLLKQQLSSSPSPSGRGSG